jgi:hypothetical protein
MPQARFRFSQDRRSIEISQGHESLIRRIARIARAIAIALSEDSQAQHVPHDYDVSA